MAKNDSFKNTIKELRSFGDEGRKVISIVTRETAKEIELTAKQLAPVDFGKLRQGITEAKVDDYHYKVIALERYSAYMEFGTGGLVSVPNELKEIAIQFKGAGVKQINLRPQPFMYPAWIKGKLNYLDDLTKQLKKLTDKYNKK
jgi:HK97 gp10 family phage protein